MLSSVVLSSLGLAAAQQPAKVTLESSDSRFDGKGVSNIHFGAALNGLLVSNSSIPYLYNTTSKNVYTTITIGGGEVIPMVFTPEGGDLVATPSGTSDAVVEDSYLAINGSNSVFYACKSLAWDPYGYTKEPSTYGIGVYASDAPDGCTPVKIAIDTAGTNSTTSSAPSSLIITSPITPPYRGANATATVKSTAFTTIDCPTPTTLTYGSSVYTITQSTVITVEDCSCTATPTASATASAHNSTGNSTATVPGIANGASHLQIGGAIGAAAVAALLL